MLKNVIKTLFLLNFYSVVAVNIIIKELLGSVVFELMSI